MSTLHVSMLAFVVSASACSDSHDVDVDATVDGSADASARVDARTELDGGPAPLCAGSCEIVQIVGGLGHTCALFDDGRVACWGSLDVLDRIGLEPFSSPTEIEGLPPMRSLIRGYTYACGMSTEDELWCWGDGTGTLLSAPLLGSSATPRNDWVTGVDGVVNIETGGAHTCALTDAGGVYCWGFRNEGQLGDGTMEIHSEPAPVVGLDSVVELSAGAGFNCARLGSGRLACWGDNGQGQIGDGTGGESSWEADRLEPVFVLDEVEHVTAGLNFACAQHVSGAVLCWGGALRGGPVRYVASPEVVELPAGLGVVDVQAATLGAHVCALAASGRVLCWGANRHGQIGFGTSGTQADAPVEAGGIDDATGIALGFSHTCAIRDRREVWCWGGNDEGQLGDGTREDRNLPGRVLGLD